MYRDLVYILTTLGILHVNDYTSISIRSFTLILRSNDKWILSYWMDQHTLCNGLHRLLTS